MEKNPKTLAAARRDLRRALHRLSAQGELPDVTLVGTAEAVRAFQKKAGLAETGEADLETWNAIFDAARRAGDTVEGTLRPGDRGSGVAELHGLLGELSLLFPAFAEAANGDGADEYGAATERAVREFQRRTMLPETGCADARTLDWMRRLARSLFLYG